MRTRQTYRLTPFPPSNRQEFDDYYERLGAFGIPKNELFKALVSDILFRGLSPAEADKATQVILHNHGDGTSPGEFEPFRKAFLIMMNPSLAEESEKPYLEAVSINTAQGMEKLRGLTTVSPDLTAQEQKLVVSMMAAAHMIQGMNEEPINKKWQSAAEQRTKDDAVPSVPGLGN